MKYIYIVILGLICHCAQSQTIYKYYAYLHNSAMAPSFEQEGYFSVYNGKDSDLRDFFSNYDIIKLDKAFPTAEREDLLSILMLETTSQNLATDLFSAYPGIYRKFDDITNDIPALTYYPNDYGSTSPTPIGLPIDRKDLDYLNVPKAWDFTTGEGTIIGISDARINLVDADLAGKVSLINPGSYQYLPYNPGLIQTFHGTGVAAIAAAQGDNNHGSTGICYDCDIIGTAYGSFNNLLLLAQAGARVINMSWVNRTVSHKENGYIEAEELMIDALVDDYHVVLVAGAGNTTSYQTQTDYFCNGGTINGPNFTGTQYCFPAAYEKVISVSAVNHKYPLIIPLLPLLPDNSPNPSYSSTSPAHICFTQVEDVFGDAISGNDPYNPQGIILNGWANYCSQGYSSSPNGLQVYYTSNEAVDMLAPTDGTLSFYRLIEENVISYLSGGTSGSAPRVTGAAGLMISVNQCLIPDEVDDILKLTSKDVEQLSFNQIFAGQIGAGALDVGDAVEFVHEMMKINGIAKVDKHIFYRFDFSLQRINNKLEISKTSFVENCKVDFTARTQIRVLEGTVLRPNSTGKVHLKIDPKIEVCPVEAKSQSHTNKNNTETVTPSKRMIIHPNPNSGTFEVFISNVQPMSVTSIEVRVMDIHGRVIKLENVITNNVASFSFPMEINSLPTGIYFVTVSGGSFLETGKFIKL